MALQPLGERGELARFWLTARDVVRVHGLDAKWRPWRHRCSFWAAALMTKTPQPRPHEPASTAQARREGSPRPPGGEPDGDHSRREVTYGSQRRWVPCP